MPKDNLTSEKPSVEKLVKEVEALKKPSKSEAVTETPDISKKEIPDIEELDPTLKSSKPFASGSSRMSWIAGGVVVAMMMGILAGYFLMKPLWAPPADEPLPGPSAEELLQPKKVAMHGVIRPLEASIYMQGEHQLVDEDGKMLAILEPGSKIQDLTFLEGSEVDVEGTAKKTAEGDMTIIEVEKVRF